MGQWVLSKFGLGSGYGINSKSDSGYRVNSDKTVNMESIKIVSYSPLEYTNQWWKYHATL